MGLFNELISPVSSLLEKVVPDSDKRAELSHEIATLASKQEQAIRLAQIEVNKAEAQSGGWFQSSWRPATAWVCVTAFAWAYVLQPVTVFVLSYLGVETPPLPELDIAMMLPVLMGMLGLGGLRSFDKTRGTDTK